MSDHDIGSPVEPLKFPFTMGIGGGAPRACHAGGAPAAENDPRLVIRGETCRPKAIVDWLSFTAPDTAFAGLQAAEDFLDLAFGEPIAVLVKRPHGLFGYLQSWEIRLPAAGDSAFGGFFAAGGASQGYTVLMSLSGTACARITNWPAIHAVLEEADATITRIDVAHDDVEGKKSMFEILHDYYNGAFKSGGRQPKCKPAGDWLNDQPEGDGRTLNIGSRGSGKFCRVYEKGRQLGDRASPWIRMEVELRRKDRWIPHDILVDPGKYLAGCYPAMRFVSDTAERIKTNRHAAKTTLNHLIEHASIASGRTINAMRRQGYSPEDIVALLMRPGLPKRLVAYEATIPRLKPYAYGDIDGDA